MGQIQNFGTDDKKGFPVINRKPLVLLGRDGVIRTLDPLHPMQVRYQAAPRPDETKLYQLGYPLDGCVQECNDAIERFVQGFAVVWC